MTIAEATASTGERDVVLAVDDNEQNLQLLEEYLWQWGYDVVVARDGREALQLYPQTNPSIIVLDVMMPNMDGWEVLRILRETPATADIPVVVCSVLREPAIALSLGAHAYLKKPVDRLELVATLARLLGPVAPVGAEPPPAPAGS
jgi:Amt family ammonium transporter